MNDLARALDLALEASRVAGRLARERFGTALRRERKPDGTWVTEADWAVEAQLRLQIARAYPGHNIHGEEEGLTRAGGGEAADGAPTWFLDPIDGTNNFMAGIPVWGVLVGLRVEGESVLGVCSLPALDETYAAARGLGATCNGREIHVSDVGSLDRATVLYADLPRAQDAFAGAFERATGSAWRTRGFGDCWGHMLVARGAAELMLEPELNVWDYTALEPIVREAGGVISQVDGTPLTDGGSCISGNPELHASVTEV